MESASAQLGGVVCENDPHEPKPACVAPGPRETPAPKKELGVPAAESVAPPTAFSVEAVHVATSTAVTVITAA